MAKTHLGETNRHSDPKRKMSLLPLSRILRYPIVPTVTSTENKQNNKQINPTQAAYWLQASNPRMPESSFLVPEHPSVLPDIHLRPFGSTIQYPWG